MIYWKDADFTKFLPLCGKYNKYCDHVVGAFDIEFSTIRDSAGDARFSFMYIWQLAINNNAVYGRTWDEFGECLANIRADLRLKIDHKLIIYVHKLGCEFAFMQKIPCLHFSELDYDFLSRDKHEIIKCVINDVFEFRDSAVYTECPLEKVGDYVGIPKLDMDYKPIRLPITPLTSSELAYCANDVLILTKFFLQEAYIYQHAGNIPLTATRCVKRIIERYLREVYYRGSAAKNKNEHNPKVLEMLQRAYFAPFIYIHNLNRDKVYDDIYDADKSSAYPQWMLSEQFPRGEFKPVDFEDVDELPTLEKIPALLKKYARRPLLINLTAVNISCKYPNTGFLIDDVKKITATYDTSNGRSKTEDIRDKRILRAKSVTVQLTDIDLKLFDELYKYDEIRINSVYAATSYGWLPPYVVRTIVELYYEKKAAKEKIEAIRASGREPTPDEIAEYERIKSRVDRIYGIFVQDPIKPKYKFNARTNNVELVGNVYIKSDNDIAVCYEWGVWLLSYERRDMYKIFTACNFAEKASGKYKTLDVVMYGDTDGVKFCGYAYNIVNQIISDYNAKVNEDIKKFCERNCSFADYSKLKGIGEFKYTHYKQFKAIKIKRYAYTTDNDHFKCVCAGLSTNNTFFKQFVDNSDKFELFTDDLSIPTEYAATKQHKYIYQHFDELVTDYQGNTQQILVDSCLCISDIGFNMQHMLDIDSDSIDIISDRQSLSKAKESAKNATKKSTGSRRR